MLAWAFLAALCAGIGFLQKLVLKQRRTGITCSILCGHGGFLQHCVLAWGFPALHCWHRVLACVFLQQSMVVKGSAHRVHLCLLRLLHYTPYVAPGPLKPASWACATPASASAVCWHGGFLQQSMLAHRVTACGWWRCVCNKMALQQHHAVGSLLHGINRRSHSRPSGCIQMDSVLIRTLVGVLL